jgi:AraC-like DNA-binding protein
MPGLRTTACIGSPAHFQRSRALATDGDDSISIIVSEGCTASQRGRDVVLGVGDAVAALHQEPARVTFGSFFAAFVPHAALASRVRDIDDATMRLIPRDTEALRLLVGYLRLVQNELAHTTPKMRRVVVTHVHDLVALALSHHRAIGESDSSAIVAARLSAALEHIAARFQQPQLGVATVARSLGVSSRYLQRLLEMSGTTFTARVNELRLQRAFTLLTQACPGERRITDIALDCGFSDISHFNRLFRSRFGDTPSGVRAGGRRAQ